MTAPLQPGALHFSPEARLVAEEEDEDEAFTKEAKEMVLVFLSPDVALVVSVGVVCGGG